MLFIKNKIHIITLYSLISVCYLFSSLAVLPEQSHANQSQLAQLEEEANSGNLSSIFQLALIYYNGSQTEIDYTKAIQYFQLAAAQGYAPAMYNLGQMFYAGKGVELNYKEAFNYFEQAAAQGYSKALFNVGIMYAKGEGTEKNFGMSYVYLLLGQSLEPNERTSQAIEYIKKNMSPKDFENAKEYIKALANS